ncbi:hypothetical protein SAMN05444487_102118 [Marininema mesophilum]|uniref:ABC-2 family transporter protein n=1 Tax=Marininema mesophilum TaxID=1048340 RepID=A0A1H2S6F2_9BACL|nr:ABC transporter permease [Marininema mesophilum]SDW27252.1 hypothetical protein SAMN05444487_102118 [Marininema mesophilum]
MTTLRLLIKNELRSKTRHRERSGSTSMPKKWITIYGALALVIVAGIATYLGIQGETKFKEIWYFNWGMLFWATARAGKSVQKEWDNETAGWWLSLPYSRGTLLTAKFFVNLIRWVKTSAVIYIALFIFILYVMALEGKGSEIFDVLVKGGQWYVLFISLSPFAIGVGILNWVIRKSMFRPMFPLLWILSLIVINILAWLFLTASLTGGEMLGIIAVSWIVTLGVVRLATHILDQHAVL